MKAVSSIEKKLQTVEKKLDDLVTGLSTRIAACEKSMESWSKNLNEIENKWQSKCTDLENDLEVSRKAAAERIKAAEKVSDDIIEATQRLRNLRIDQLPEVEGEPLKRTVTNLFSRVGCRLDERTRYYRLKTGRSNGTIIVNFATEAEKEIFFSNYIKVAKDLLVSNFIANPKHKEARVYVSQDLCQTQYRIWKELSKVKEGVIKHQRVHRGFVYIKTKPDEPPQRILSLNMLKEVVNKA